MAKKGIQTGLILTVIVLTLSLGLPGPVRAESRESDDSKPMVLGDAVLQKVDPLKCPIGQECQDQSQIHTDSDTTSTSKTAPFAPRGLWHETKESNSEISNEKTERAMDDAPLTIPEPGTGTRPSRSKGRSKANKKMKRKNRRRKCRQRRRKLKVEKKMRKRGGKGKNGRKGMGRKKGKKGKKNKRMKKCGKRKRRKNGRKRRKNERKRKNGKLNIGNGIDNSNTTTNSILDSISSVQETRKQKTLDVNVIGSGGKDIGTKSKQFDADSSLVGHNSERTTRQKEAVVGDKGVSSRGEPEFDAIQITALFQEALHSDPSGQTFVDFDNYVKAYKRLGSVFHFFGPIFSFAKSDLEEKINVLGQLRSSSIQGQNGENYKTFKSMFEYEYSKGIAQPGGQGISGVRENAWIHRALKFIIAIIRTMTDKTETSPLHSRVKQFYTEILAPYHSWLVRMGVYAAIYSFPSRETLLKDMKITDDAEGMRELTRLAESIQTIYDLIQVHYEKYAPSK